MVGCVDWVIVPALSEFLHRFIYPWKIDIIQSPQTIFIHWIKVVMVFHEIELVVKDGHTDVDPSITFQSADCVLDPVIMLRL